MTDYFAPVHLIFYLFSAIAVGSAIAVVTTRNPVRSVLSLVLTFFAMSGIWMELRAEFLSLILLLVYVGAVMTLFLFVVMMINIDRADKRVGFVKYLPFGLFAMAILVALLIAAEGPATFGITHMPVPAPEPADYNNVLQLANVLYINYAYPVEIAGVILLAAMITAITLAHRRPNRRKMQNPAKQIAVRPEDRLRIIKMPPVKPENGQGS